MYLFIMCTFLMKYFSIPFFSFSNWIFFFTIEFWKSLIYVIYQPSFRYVVYIFFFQFVSFFFFILLAVSFTEHTFCFVFDMVQCVNLYFSETDFDISLRTFYLSTEDFFFSLSFIILLLTFKSIFHFELAFM